MIPLRRPVPALLLLLAACSSPPGRFYELTPEPAAQARPLYAAAGNSVAIGAVNLPGELDRPQMARRIGPNQLAFAEDDRWAGPLDDMVRRVLAEDLAERLGAGTVPLAAGPGIAAERTVAVDVLRFDADPDGRVTLAARWQTLGRTAPLGRPRQSTIVEPGSGGDAAGIAAAMSQALAALAAQIAADLG
ncbi:MAG: membrane integrity-associated transporter subunit PqiC [Alphaproteobacteria bacterium]|nr:membrane integrity-associated transporter subunit PqiC [Alphaproteobacteria bacterium]